jgi:hypothetical protein
VDLIHVQRFACYMSLLGHSDYSAIADGFLLLHVDATQYFPTLSLNGPDPAEKYTTTRQYFEEKGPRTDQGQSDDFITRSGEGPTVVYPLQKRSQRKDSEKGALKPVPPFASLMEEPPTGLESSKRKKYKIAYLLLAHENFDALVRVVQSLYTEEGFFLIHVDASNPDLDRRIRSWLLANDDEIRKNGRNIQVFEKPFPMQWGGCSIVFAQLEGFYRLLDTADWDYVINLSVYDYPLMSTAAMHHFLLVSAFKVVLS